MKKILFISLISLIIHTGCLSQEYVTLKIYFPKKTIEKKIKTDTSELELNAFQMNCLKIEGLEKLKNLKKLKFYSGFSDFSFLKDLPALETLILSGTEVIDLSFIKQLSKLKILYVNGCNLKKQEIDLAQNKKLTFLGLHNMNIFENMYKYKEENGKIMITGYKQEYERVKFTPVIKNIPDSLQYLSLDFNPFYLEMTEEFLKSVIKVPMVIIDEIFYEQHQDFVKNNKNITYFDWHNSYEADKKYLPEEFREDTLLKEIETKLNPIDFK